MKPIDAPSIVWFRKDLRLNDNPAFFYAAKKGPVIPVFIWSPSEEDLEPGGASKVWLYHSLISLEKQLEALGLDLIISKGNAFQSLLKIIKSTNAKAIYCNKRYEPLITKRDHEIEHSVNEIGLEFKSFDASLLIDPKKILNKNNQPFKVFSHFWKNCLSKINKRDPLPIPENVIPAKKKYQTLSISDLSLEEGQQWTFKILRYWDIDEVFSQNKLKSFVSNNFSQYSENRNIPSIDGTSKLSPYLHYGQTSPNQIFYELSKSGQENWKESQYLAEIGWREFGYYLMFHFPKTINEPLRQEFKNFPWEKNEVLFRAWKNGKTGYPLVDAGMRELWETGWMHNRVRMVVASFLVKHLLIDWKEGAKWFWDTLVDADLASNTLGWQWSAGCGADAAPYFRIFNPTTQLERFDNQGDYIRRWIPELKKLESPNIFQPYKYNDDLFFSNTYPKPVVEHDVARKKALLAYRSIK